MLKIASRIERRVPTARSAAKDDPYSTIRRSPRWYQTRCGMWWTSGCAPVAIEERQTGVRDGNVEVARPYSPCSARKRSAGAWLSSALSKVAAARPSITTRMTFLSGTACGAGVRTCGLCARVPLNRPVDTPRSDRDAARH
jgi:hypothetical protein